MTLLEFNKLDLSRQVEITWDNGLLEDNKADEKRFYLIYRLFNFFVEIAFDQATEEVSAVRSYQPVRSNH